MAPTTNYVTRLELTHNTNGTWNATATYRNSSTGVVSTWTGVITASYITQSESSTEGIIYISLASLGSTYKFETGTRTVEYEM